MLNEIEEMREQIKELKEGALVKELEDFMNQIFQRRAENLSQIPCVSLDLGHRMHISPSSFL